MVALGAPYFTRKLLFWGKLEERADEQTRGLGFTKHSYCETRNDNFDDFGFYKGPSRSENAFKLQNKNAISTIWRYYKEPRVVGKAHSCCRTRTTCTFTHNVFFEQTGRASRRTNPRHKMTNIIHIAKQEWQISTILVFYIRGPVVQKIFFFILQNKNDNFGGFKFMRSPVRSFREKKHSYCQNKNNVSTSLGVLYKEPRHSESNVNVLPSVAARVCIQDIHNAKQEWQFSTILGFLQGSPSFKKHLHNICKTRATFRRV